MRQTSALYKTLRTTIDAFYEVEVILQTNPTRTYSLEDLKSLNLHPALFDQKGPKIGGVYSTQCDLVVLETSANWPRMAAFDVRVRLSTESGSQTSEWLTLGRFYTDERVEDSYGVLSITAYDGMLMMEQYWTDKIPEEYLPAEWPITSYAFANMIQNAGLATFNNIATLDNTVAFVGLSTAITIRDVLKSIASAHSSNWMVTSDGQLKLIPLVNPSEGVETIDLGQDVKSLDTSPVLPEVTQVHLENEEGDSVEYGNVSGYTLNGECEFSSTTGLAELALSRANRFVYRPFTAVGAMLDPAAEVGDLVTIDSKTFQIMKIDWNINTWPTATVSAPCEEEVDHEYPVLNKETKHYRKTLAATDAKLINHPTIAQMESALVQTASSITATVSSTYVTVENYEAAISQIEDQISGTITSYSGAAVPTLNNYPAVDWETSEEKAQHVGNVYLVTSDSGSAMAGQYYRFEQNGNQFGWVLITDSALAQALAEAQAAQEAAALAIADAEAASAAASAAQGTADYASAKAEAEAAQAQALAIAAAALDATAKANAALAEAKAYADQQLQNFLSTDYQEVLLKLKEQLDQKAETFYQGTDPKLDWSVAIVNDPNTIAGVAVVDTCWLDHEGDLWYNTASGENEGTTWRWDGSQWVRQDVPTEVFDKIDGKAQIFISQPFPPYAEGDLWFNSSTEDIKTCVNARESGNFVATDWEKRNKYTDDTKANAVDVDLQGYKQTVTAEFQVQSASISAKVSKSGGSTSQANSFGWVLDDTSHTWYASGAEVMKVNKDGLTVNGGGTFTGNLSGASGDFSGTITASSGSIGGFTISGSGIYNGITSMSDTDHQTGVYIGTDGIKLGQAFSVTSSGQVTASNMSISGSTFSGSITGGSINIADRFIVSEQGYVTAAFTGGSISLGDQGDQYHTPVFYVSSLGAVSASNMNITGGSIVIKDTNNQTLFSASSSGVTIAGNAQISGTVYAGQVYAGNILYATDQSTASYGTLSGAAITDNTFDGGKILDYTIQGDYDPDTHTAGKLSGGSIGGFSGGSLGSGVLGSLSLANGYGLAIDNTSGSYPAYFCATSITALSSFFAPSYMVDAHTEFDLATHVHSFNINETTGDVTLGPPTGTASAATFNIADTDFYRDRVSAIRISSLAGTSYTSDDSIVSGLISNKDSTVYMNNTLYGCFTASYGDNTQTIRVGLNAEKVKEEAKVVQDVLITQSIPDSQIVPNYDNHSVSASFDTKAQYTDLTTSQTYSKNITLNATKIWSSVTIPSANMSVTKSGSYYYDSHSRAYKQDVIANATASNGENNSIVVSLNVDDVYTKGNTDGGKDVTFSAIAQKAYNTGADRVIALTDSGTNVRLNGGMMCGNISVSLNNGKVEDWYIGIDAGEAWTEGNNAALNATAVSDVLGIGQSGSYSFTATVAKANTTYENSYIVGYTEIRLNSGKNTTTARVRLHGGLAYEEGVRYGESHASHWIAADPCYYDEWSMRYVCRVRSCGGSVTLYSSSFINVQ